MRSHVAGLLDCHLPFDDTEAQHRRSMLELVRSGGDPFDRTHFGPGHFTASAFVLSPGRDALLMVLHSKLQRWLQPGGHIEAADTSVEAAARREVFEETHLADLRLELQGFLDVDVHPIPARPGEPMHLHFDLRLCFASAHHDVVAGPGVDAVRFVPFGELERTLDEPSLQRVLAKIRTRESLARQAQA